MVTSREEGAGQPGNEETWLYCSSNGTEEEEDHETDGDGSWLQAGGSVEPVPVTEDDRKKRRNDDAEKREIFHMIGYVYLLEYRYLNRTL